MRPTRLLVVCQHFWPENFRINDICEFMVERGCDVEVLCGLPNYPSGKFPEGYGYFKNRRQNYKGVKIQRAIEIPRGNNTNLRIFLNYVSFPITSLFRLPRLLMSKRYDQIFLYQLSPVMMTITGILLGKLRRIETTMYVLDLWPENLYSVLPIRNRFLRHIAESVSHWHYRHVDKLVVLSETMKDRIIAITGKPADKVLVLPQACEKVYETPAYDKQLQERFSPGFNIVFTGSITPAQSFETIIESAKYLKAEGIHDINWIIVGDGMSRQAVEKEVNRTGLQEIFHFEGQHPIEDMPKYTAIANILVGCLVKSELLQATIPAKVFSYIASGKPVVLAMDGEVRTLINDRIKCGLVSETEDSKVLAENIKHVYSLSAKERAAMGKRARDYHFKYLTRDLVLAKLYAFINQGPLK